MADSAEYRDLGPTEVHLSRCHQQGNMNITVALTIHTRAPLDLGVVKVGLQEIQHQHPQLTSRIARKGGKEVFAPMECPVLPLDDQFTCKDMIHQRFDVERGPLWRVQIVTQADMENSNISFGPEIQAILEDDSSVETRWRYILRYMQGRLNRDIDSFERECEEEEGRSVILMTFHPCITDATGALHLANQFMSILDLKLQLGEEPLSLGDPEPFPKSLESLLPPPDSLFQFGDLVPLVKAVGSHFIPLRRSPFEDLLVTREDANGNEPRSQFLRGWLSEAETRDLVALCEEEDVSLHGIVLAAGLTAMARLCLPTGHQSPPPPTSAILLRVAIAMNLRQYCTQTPRHGCLSSHYEDSLSVAPVVEAVDLWRLAHSLTMTHNTAKANRLALRHVRMAGKIPTTAGGLEAAFRDSENARRIDSELSLTIYGDLGHIFRRESVIQCNEQQQQQVRLEDVMVMVSAQTMGCPFSHSAHIFRGRLNYVLGYFTSYADTAQALMLRDETVNLLRLAIDQ